MSMSKFSFSCVLVVCTIYQAMSQVVITPPPVPPVPTYPPVPTIPSAGGANGTAPQEIFNTEVCYNNVGCFKWTGDFYDFTIRPFSLLPADPNTMNIQFSLYTRANRTNKQVLTLFDKSSIQNSDFDGSKKTKFIIHGFTDNAGSEWLLNMTRELLIQDDYNVITVDWSNGAAMPYTKATANTRVVGAYLSVFIKYLGNETGLLPGNCHIMGHSLGAHTAGYCGERFKDSANKATLSRISGLDPAYPYFEGMPSSVVLDPTDAMFVDVIHTDGRNVPGGGFGINAPAGHFDFYPNSGVQQPGCTNSALVNAVLTGGFSKGMELVACSHSRVLRYYTESINTNCHMIGFECGSWKNFKDQKCGDCAKAGQSCVTMGFHSDNYYKPGGTRKRFYMATNELTPFCYHYYWSTMVLEQNGGTKDVRAIVDITLDGKANKATDRVYSDVSLFHSDDFEKSNSRTYTQLVASKKHLGQINNGSVLWTRYNTLCVTSCYDKVFVKKLNVRELNTSSVLPSMSYNQDVTLCYSGQPVYTKVSMNLLPGNC